MENFLFYAVCLFTFANGSPAYPSPCPKDQVYYRVTGKCYPSTEIGNRGPCNQAMTFVRDETKANEAICACSIFYREGCPSRPIVLWTETNRCFPAYEKGPCKAENEWFVPNHQVKGQGLCQVNVENCKNYPSLELQDRTKDEDNLYFWAPSILFEFPLDGKCVRTGSHDICKESQSFYFFQGYGLAPKCMRDSDFITKCNMGPRSSLSLPRALPCPPGTKQYGNECYAISMF